ncbi:hypothetical protein FRB90_000012 [Tulasnella sp. 427]|nr:hypothetical protein FRB90_000012 [Tulasnella sp. 427]
MFFQSLSDDVLIEVFARLDFPSIIALRLVNVPMVSRRLKDKDSLNAFNRLTEDATDWRALLEEFPTPRSSEDLESLVTKMVRFEINWSHGRPRSVRELAYVPIGPAEAILVPGGRWYLRASTKDSVTLRCYDLDSPGPEKIQSQVLHSYRWKTRHIWAMDVSVDREAPTLEFDVALELVDRSKNGLHGSNITVSG